MTTFTVHVGWTNVRPVRPDQAFSSVRISADTPGEALELAALMTMRPASPAIGLSTAVEMPTSAVIVDWE